MGKEYKILLALIVINLVAAPIVFPIEASSIVLEPFFAISILSFDNYKYAAICIPFIDHLDEIGIELETFDHTGWSAISSRTWSYPGPYPIPNYTLGGYDLFFASWRWGIDYSPWAYYESSQITPSGDNYLQYNSPEMDLIIQNYRTAFNHSERDFWANEFQQQLYFDLPEIPISYMVDIYPHDGNLTGWDPNLWANYYQPMNNWSISGQTEFRYLMSGEPNNFHIYDAENYNWKWLRQIYNGMIERHPPTNLWDSRVAIDYSTTNYINWTVHLDPLAKWGDGTPITAHDVIYSYQIMLDPVFTNPIYSNLNEYLDNESIVYVDNHTINVNFKQEYLYNEANLGMNLIPKRIWEGIAAENQTTQALDWTINQPEKIFGSGPYRLHFYNSSSGLVHLKKNPYFGDLSSVDGPYFDDVYFEVGTSHESAIVSLAANEVDMVDEAFVAAFINLNDYGVNYTEAFNGVVVTAAVNNEHPYLGTGESCPIAGRESARYIRTALSYLYDRPSLITDPYGNHYKPTATAFPLHVSEFNESIKPYDYDLSKAKYYMELAGFEFQETLPGTTLIIGINFPIVLRILGLIGGYCYLKRKRRNR